MILMGNFDSEGMAGAQSFGMPGGAGNFQSESYSFSSTGTGNWSEEYLSQVVRKLNGEEEQASYFSKIGSAFRKMMSQDQGGMMGGAGGGEAPIMSGNLTSGFNSDWLGQALSAGSANGQKIGGMMGGMMGK